MAMAAMQAEADGEPCGPFAVHDDELDSVIAARIPDAVLQL